MDPFNAQIPRRRALTLLGTCAGALLSPPTLGRAADAMLPPAAVPAPGTPLPQPPITGYLLKYHLASDSAQWPPDKYRRIVDAMDRAVGLYNQLGQFPKEVTAYYSPGTPTADGNYNGTIRFGGQIGLRVALHELGHVLGGGTHPNWSVFAVNGHWTGPYAQAQLRALDGPDAVLSCDRIHFWPYGMNYDSEGSPENLRRHVLMLAALRRDMGITTGEPFKGLAGVGTWNTQAEFRNFQVAKGNLSLFRTSITSQDSSWKMLRGKWSWEDGVLRQTGPEQGALAVVGDRTWTDYTLTLEARKTGGKEGFLIAFGMQGDDTKSWWNLGGSDNTRFVVEAPGVEAKPVDGHIETDRWYGIRVDVIGSTVRCYLENKLVQEASR